MQQDQEVILSLINEIKNAESYEDFEIHELIGVLEYASDRYYNFGDSPLSDDVFDSIETYAYVLDPTNEYFIGVGSDVRGGKIDLPYQMGGLDQIEIGYIREWIKKHALDKEQIVVSDKMDGTSALLIYDSNGNPQIAYSRGNGTQGADITRHIKQIANVPKKVSGKMVIRGEVELTETAFVLLRDKEQIRNRANKPYKNSRNMAAGLMNAEENNPVVYSYLTFIAYEIVNSDLSKTEQLNTLETEKFQTVEYTVFNGKDLTDDVLAKHITARKGLLDYAIDGVVLDVESSEKRLELNPTRDTLNPAYSIKYKVADASNLAIATVERVEWRTSKHTYKKPRVQIKPVNLMGVTISYATGFNARFIVDNGIGPGAKIKITRSGDVIPYIIGVVEKTTPDMPTEEYEWTVNDEGERVDIYLKHADEETVIQQTIAFFTAVDIPNLKEGSVRIMFTEHNYTDFSHAIISMLNYDKAHWFSCLGVNGTKIYDGLRDKFNGISSYVLLGATPFFGRGVGGRMFRKFVKTLQLKSMSELPFISKSQIITVEGFEDKTATKIIQGVNDFMGFYEKLPTYVTVKYEDVSTSDTLKGEKIVFTGFRDKNLAALVEQAGGEMKNSVSGKTTIVVAINPTGNSGKLQKAREMGIRVIGTDELLDMLGDVAPPMKKKKTSHTNEEKLNTFLEF